VQRMSSALLIGYLCVLLTPSEAVAQDTHRRETGGPREATSQGSVVSATPNTLVIRTDDGQYELFVLDENTTRPTAIPIGSQVSVEFVPQDNGVPAADAVKVTAMPATQTPPSTQGAPPTTEPVPASVRRAEQDIVREARRYRFGFRGGAALDPELVTFGVQSQIGPFFNENVWARPNLEFGFGELTTLVALNLEAAYRLPVVPRRTRWAVFIGGGPGLNFARSSFSASTSGSNISFSDLSLDVGLNVLIGVQSRGGFFMELRSSAFAAPHLRFQVGQTF
jgi:hypothetical protein